MAKKKKKGFKLKDKRLLRDVINRDPKLSCNNNNLTEELALYHLKTNPGYLKYFEEVPDDLEKRLKSYILPKKEKRSK